ncbi:MAG: serine/threonine-protein kinase [Acidimicrobiales bacterium]
MATVPFVLDGFEPIERLGGGGFGEVWLARQVNIDRRVAIKVGHAPIDDKTVQLRFERECIALGRLSGHPNIVDVYTAGSMADGRPYLVLEYVSGGTLWQRLQAQPLTEAELMKVGAQLSAALSVAHSSGVLHRDLKPENILLRPNGDAVLGDFGIARLHDGANTTSHAITASVAYAPPEILSGGTASVTSDIYGIGICLLAGVIRSVPFVASGDESIHPIINRVLTDRPPDLRQHGVSPDLNELIHQLLAKDPAKRPPSADEVQRRLEGIAASRFAAPPPADRGQFPLDHGATRPASSAGMAATVYAPASPGPPPAPAYGSSPAYNGAPAAYAAAPSGPQPFAPSGYGQPPGPDPTGGVELAPFQSQPYARTGQPPGPVSLRPDHEMNRLRLLGAVFGATLLLGGLLVFALLRVLGSEGDGGSPDSIVTGDTTQAQNSLSASTNTTAPPAPTAPATSAPVLTGPLTLPLLESDLGLKAAETEPDTAGPDSIQYCDNTPNTAGLGDWVGQTASDVLGFPSVFQQLARFDTAEAAGAYMDAYTGTVDCAEWVLPASNDGPEVTLRPQVVDAPTRYGDDTREIRFDGTSSFVPLYGRVAIVRRSTDVYLVSITSLLESDLADLDRLLGQAVANLGY